jgi:hypothetical protein
MSTVKGLSVFVFIERHLDGIRTQEMFDVEHQEGSGRPLSGAVVFETACPRGSPKVLLNSSLRDKGIPLFIELQLDADGRRKNVPRGTLVREPGDRACPGYRFGRIAPVFHVEHPKGKTGFGWHGKSVP